MELLAGMNLSDMAMRFGRIPAARVIHLLRQICGALEEAHGAGLIHRDIKPANIFATRRGGVWDVAKLLDFGIVKQESSAGDAADESWTGGSPHYMSPERFHSADEVDERTDIYALGVTAYRLLTGQEPFAGQSAIEIITAHQREAPRPPSQIEPSISDDLEKVVLKCLAKDPADRFQRAEELEAALAVCAAAGGWTKGDAEAWWREHKHALDEDNAALPMETSPFTRRPRPK